MLEFSDAPRLPQDVRSVMLSGIFDKIVCDRVRPLAAVGHFIGG